MQAVGDCSLGDAVMAPAVFEVKIKQLIKKKKTNNKLCGLCKSEQKSPKAEIVQSDKSEGYIQHFGFKCFSASIELDIYTVIFVHVYQITVLTAKFCSLSHSVLLMCFALSKIKNCCKMIISRSAS